MQQDEQPHDDEEQHVPHGALADLFARADRIREAYDELRGGRVASDGSDAQQ